MNKLLYNASLGDMSYLWEREYDKMRYDKNPFKIFLLYATTFVFVFICLSLVKEFSPGFTADAYGKSVFLTFIVLLFTFFIIEGLIKTYLIKQKDKGKTDAERAQLWIAPYMTTKTLGGIENAVDFDICMSLLIDSRYKVDDILFHDILYQKVKQHIERDDLNITWKMLFIQKIYEYAAICGYSGKECSIIKNKLCYLVQAALISYQQEQQKKLRKINELIQCAEAHNQQE